MLLRQPFQFIEKFYPVLILIPVYGFLVFWSVNDFFFWDTVQLASLHASYFYENGFGNFLLPDSMDSGHIPVFGYYLALIWKLFDRTLAVSHLSMAPFIIVYLFYLYKCCERIYASQWKWPFLLIGFMPVMLAQVTLISPDVVLMCLFLVTIYGILAKRQLLLILGLTALGCISIRGFIVVVAILLTEIINKKAINKLTVKQLIPFIPAIALPVGYQLYHFLVKGWSGFHSDSPWSESFSIAGPVDILKNIVLIGWRLTDFGMLIPLFLLLTLWLFTRSRDQLAPSIKLIWKLTLFILIGLAVPALLFKQLTGHRYFLPASLLMLMLASYYFNQSRKPALLYCVSIISMLSGHLWIYPAGVSQGWDASLAYKPFVKHQYRIQEYIQNNKINKNDVCTYFPSKLEGKYIFLNSDTIRHKDFNPDCPYVFLSKIHNDVTDQDMILIDSLYYPVNIQTSLTGIKSILYKRKHVAN